MTDMAKNVSLSIDSKIDVQDIAFKFDDRNVTIAITLPQEEYSELKRILQQLESGDFDWEVLFKLMREVSLRAYRHFHKSKKQKGGKHP